MTRKCVETLLVLTENAGQVVPKDELLSTIWPDRVVDEANLTQNIAMVRRALSAERGMPAFIETFPGRGYRLTGPVTVEDPQPLAAQAIPVPTPTGLPVQPADPPISVAAVTVPAAKKWTRISVLGCAAVLLVGVVGWVAWRMMRPAVSAGFRVTPFTRLSGGERQPALSADGKSVAFLWERGDGQPSPICVQRLGESSNRQVTREVGHYSSPAWSPDGRALAYLRMNKDVTEVLISLLDFNDLRIVARFSPPNYSLQRRLLDWSPDGQWLAVSHPSSASKPNSIYLVAVATGEQRLLTQPDQMVGGDIEPHFSPDSRTLSFVRYIHRSRQELFSLSVTGGQPKQLTDDGKQISGHDWMPDGNQIIFASDRGGEFRLWKLNSAAQLPERQPPPVGIFGEYPMEISLARSAQTLVYSIQAQDRNIWRLDLKDRTWTRLIASSAQDASPQYSPTGDRICFRSDRTGEDHLWVSDADGNQQTQITQEALYPSVGRWSPDGRQIAFNNARSGELYLAALSTDAAPRWTVRRLGVSGIHPVFSPDGASLYAGGPNSIVRISLADNSVKELVNTGGFSLGLSPDGKSLYFIRGLNETILWQANTETGALTQSVAGLIPGCTSCWALTAQGVYYLGGNSRSFDEQVIYFFDFATQRQREVLKYPEPLAPLGSGPFSLSPEQRYLLCVRSDPSSSDIMRVEPFE